MFGVSTCFGACVYVVTVGEFGYAGKLEASEFWVMVEWIDAGCIDLRCVSVSALRFPFRLPMMKARMAAHMIRTRAAIPTPIPTFAPVESEWLGSDVGGMVTAGSAPEVDLEGEVTIGGALVLVDDSEDVVETSVLIGVVWASVAAG